jgi:hypothetical protein
LLDRALGLEEFPEDSGQADPRLLLDVDLKMPFIDGEAGGE